jgi:subtilisin family serine protease
MCVLGCAIVVYGAADAQAGPRSRGSEIARGRRAAAGEVLVRLRQPAQGRAASTLLADPLADLEEDEPVGRGEWRLVRSRSRSADLLVEIMRARGDVAVAEPNYEVHLMGTPNDLASPLWALQNTGQRLENGETGTPGVDIDALGAWAVTQGSRRVVIATVDTGVMATHPDLAANLWSAPRAFTVTIGGQRIECPTGSHGFNVITRTCNPADDNGHGTHVAGTLGAVGNNGSGVVGVNWATSIMALKFMDAAGDGYVSDAMNAIEFALQVKQAFAATGDADIRVLNNSWSGGGYSQALSDMIARAGNAGMLFVVSAGNTGANHEVTPVYPSDYSGANVLSVAATDYRDQLGAFSDYGSRHVHLAAPGVLIHSTALSADPGGAYGTQSGTSMATAFTSGVAALVLAHCNYSPGALRDALLRAAKPVAGLAGRVSSSARLNAAGAVRSCDATTSAAREIVVRAADVPSADRHGAWTRTSDTTAADGVSLATPDAGWTATAQPFAQPQDFFDVRFTPDPGVPYRLWLRMKAGGDSKWNDSVWLQFSDARLNGTTAYGINSESGIAINLENCSNCGMSGWGWQDGAYWLARTTVTFGPGTQTMRVQTREDGVAIDQIVISAGTWLNAAPGQVSGDSTIVPRSTGGAATPGPGTSSSSTPFSGTPITLPGTVQVENFDNGGEGVAFHDTDALNSGAAYRSTGVDIEATAGGGYNVGWVAAGEWLAYTVNIQAAGTYTAQFRVAASGMGGRFHLEIDGSNVSGSLAVPDTGWWQTWQTVTAPVALPVGTHVAKLVMETNGVNAVGNFDWFSLASGPAAQALPGRIDAVRFDDGGEGVAYHDDSAGNSGGALRTTDVDIESSSEGGHNVGWIGAGEWLRYTVSVGTAGSYVLKFRVASPDGGGVLHVLAGSTNITGPVSVPRTGGWQVWTTVTVPVTLGTGTQAMRLVFDTGGFNVHRIEVAAN